MARLSTRVWDNTMLTTNTKMKVYQARVLSTLLYSRRILGRRILGSPGKTTSQTKKSSSTRECRVFLPFSLINACAGLAISGAWRMAEFLRTCCTMCWLPALDQLEGLF